MGHGGNNAAGTPASRELAEAYLAPLLESLSSALAEQSLLCDVLVSSAREASLSMLCRVLRPVNVLSAVLATLMEERILIVGSDPLLVFRAAETLAAALDPLVYCGAPYPYCPRGCTHHRRRCSTTRSSRTLSVCTRRTTRG